MTKAGLPDQELIDFTHSILSAAQAEWGAGFVIEPNGRGHPAQLYTDTHYAWSAVLLSLLKPGEESLLEVAHSRLALWDGANGPMTFFNAMAVCLTLIECRRAGVQHSGLLTQLESLIARTTEHEAVAFDQWCGNNAYLQQVAVDSVLLPLARGREVEPRQVAHLASAFRRYRTPEGWYHDLPRTGGQHEKLYPPTYVMKILFLLGVCHQLTSAKELGELFDSGMAAAIPLLNREGQLSYFGRTDNSPFAAGLTIFNLRKALEESYSSSATQRAARRAERFYLESPRTPVGLLRCNRFADGSSQEEHWRSQDDYAYEGQYSLASTAYALLACRWFPGSGDGGHDASPPSASVVVSNDLGVAKLNAGPAEVILRTHGEITAWDRRYLGPTILRYSVDRNVHVGAISKTLSTDWAVQPRARSRVGRAKAAVLQRFEHGFDQLAVASVGFLPVIRSGTRDYLPIRLLEQNIIESGHRARYATVALRARGFGPCLVVAGQAFYNALPWVGPRRYTPPPVEEDGSVELERTVWLDPRHCRVVDRLSGDIKGKTVVLTVRSMPGTEVNVRGLHSVAVCHGLGSDGRQTIETYEIVVASSELAYEYEIAPAAFTATT